MRTIAPIRRRAKPSEEGYILVAVIFMLAIMIIAMTVAAPIIKKSIQRERELETMHRGKQYARAVKLYYKKFGTYPPNLDALVKTNDIRFLRKKYIDPTTGKDEWKVIRVGQQKTQTLGFFGQPIGGAGMPGANGLAGTGGTTGGSPIGGLGSSNSFGSNGGSSILGGATGSTGSSTDPNGGSGSASGSGSTDPGNGQNGGTGTTGTDSGSGSAFGTPGSGQTFGGLGIMGFSPNSPKQSILVYKKKNHYSDWEFLYDALADQMMMQGGGNLGTIGQPVGNPGGGIGIGGGAGIGGGSFGGGTGIGGGSTISPPGGTNPGGSSPTPPTTPQQ
jgi:type II secretory pathway pseudopilin PulG